MTNALIVLAFMWAAPAPDDATVPKMDVPNLESLTSKEAELVQTVRRFDLQQKALADWDRRLADYHDRANEPALAKDKHRQAEQRYAQIQTMYEQLLKRYPNNARVLNYYGEILYDYRKDIPKAIESWKMANVFDSKLPEPLNNLGIHYCHYGEYVDGFRYFDEALKLDPDNPDFLYNVAQNYLIYRQQAAEIKKWPVEKVYHEAMKLSKRAAELSPNSYELVEDYAVNFFAAEEFDVKANWREAAGAWQKARAAAIERDQIFFTWLNEARAWKRDLNKDKALECLLEARKLQPESDVVKRLLAEVNDFTAVQEPPAKPNKKK
ncbi:MAG: hypothetical protein HZB26_26330 [Candidatus Hydrogenedentes bacterium]|nr:hypothetical protein [Candidatus Hydrogenedentota bacterium]